MYTDRHSQIFRQNLTALWAQSGQSMRTLADNIGVTTSTLSRYMSGARRPELTIAIKICDYFNVSLDWLFGLTGTNNELYDKDVNDVTKLYSVANESDKLVIRTILARYRKD